MVPSANSIHVQQHKTNMINEEWNKTQNGAPLLDDKMYEYHDLSMAATFADGNESLLFR